MSEYDNDHNQRNMKRLESVIRPPSLSECRS